MSSTPRARKHQPSVAAFISFLAANNGKHYTQCLLDNGYHLENLHKLTARDLTALRITSQKERDHLLGLAKLAGEMCNAAAEKREAVDAATQGGAAVPAPDSTFTATLATSNERCRQATIYVEHHRIDRSWPCAGSDLTRGLSLSHATPHAGSHTLYTIAGATPREVQRHDHISHPDAGFSLTGKVRGGKNGGSTKGSKKSRSATTAGSAATSSIVNTQRWKPTLRRLFDDGLFGEAPNVPLSSRRAYNNAVQHDPAATLNTELGSPNVAVPRSSLHTHGNSAAYCGVCEQHVIDAAVEEQGQWQYLCPKEVVTGVDCTETVPVWEPFEPLDCLVLEHGIRQRKPRVKVGKYMADLKAMLWGPHKIRRVSSSAVPFPSLKKSELVHPPELDKNAEQALEEDLKASFQRLIIVEEERARFYLYHTQHAALDELLDEIAAMMHDLFEDQRQQLMAEEEAARQRVFDDNFGINFDDLWAEAEKNAARVQLGDVRRSSENILLRQQDMMAKLEELGRDRVILEERAARENLDKLLARFNAQVRALLQTRFQPVADTTRRCRVCRKTGCTFLHHPWRGQWRHHGPEYPEEAMLHTPRRPKSAKNGAEVSDADKIPDRRPRRPRVDPPLCAPYVSPGGYASVAELIGAAKEIEYTEYLRDKRRQRTDEKSTSPSRRREVPQLKASTDDAPLFADTPQPATPTPPPPQLQPRRPQSAGPIRPPFRPSGPTLVPAPPPPTPTPTPPVQKSSSS